MNGIIIAGGKSTRMGQDKAFVSYNGKCLIEYAIKLLSLFCKTVTISANDFDKYAQFDLPIVADSIKDIGPIGGLYSALSVSADETNIVIPVDMPLITKDLISYLLSNHQAGHITTPFHNGLLEPLCAIYPTSAVFTIKSMISQENYKLYNLLDRHPTNKVDVTHLLKHHPEMLSNFNRPSDL